MKRQPLASAPATPVTLGIEGGATNTTWAILDAAGNVVGKGKGNNSGNLHHLDDAQLASLFASIRAGIGAGFRVAAIGGAFAGCHLPAAKLRAENHLRAVWPDVEKIVVGEDTRSAFAAAHGDKDGIIVIAGTGSNVQGRNGDRWEKAGGWGHLFGDFGGGYDIARRGLEAAYKHFDSTGETGLLAQAFLEKSGQNNLVEFVTWILEHDSKTEVASLVLAVFEAAAKGDKLAHAALAEGAAHLADRVLFVARRLGLKKPDIGIIGSLPEKNPFYFAMFEKEVRKRITAGRLFIITLPGAVGAALMIPGTALSDSAAQPAKKGEKAVKVMKAGKAIAATPYAQATTEERNPRSGGLDKKSVADLVALFVDEERQVEKALKKAEPSLVAAAGKIAAALKAGGRLFYVGAGTSGRLGILDASEMPPTFNVPPSLVQGIIAGGSEAVFKAQEGAEDSADGGRDAIRSRGIGKKDIVVGITASGTAPFVRAAIEEAARIGAQTVLLVCNPNYPKLKAAKTVVVLPTGPELVTGSTRLKAGTATKLALNLFSTIAMIRTGRVRDNLMINVRPTNVKLKDRARRLVKTLTGVSDDDALKRLEKTKWDVAKAVDLKK
ncbi:N-acetylmuramic acid 6-phosphate etherase [Verrucomicrobium sp. GAS474]|uniref:N-acetylmuramic acid 6-phosphate etherase n=1 Tax=Verrucomicrobium sp. GAS474 TaxID=1882831 RepID=UPI00087A5270|nr:N-acetylmuramic acid 6-phosphate etherase [Verrucomicrobium sp. GAS474]SDU26358.1 N-acetylmuramic acid 6-phosphate etherase [Verrucomicrobium sp. GAS474]